MTSPNHELSILLPRPAALTNSDDWPIFELKGVDIFDPSDPLRLPAVLLHAGSYKPLTITGKLAPLAMENNHLLLKHSYARNQSIEITDVKEFSYGQYDNGNIDLWAAGHAGWYTIHPSRAYRDVYMNMLQSIRLLYFAGDSYKGVKTYADLPIERFFYSVSIAKIPWRGLALTKICSTGMRIRIPATRLIVQKHYLTSTAIS